MKTSNVEPSGQHAAAATRGSRSTNLAGAKGMIWRDASTTSVGQIRDMTVVGLGFLDNEDGTGVLSAGGAGTDDAPGISVLMLNNSGSDLVAGSVVVVDDDADNAVTTTTTPADTRIVGVVMEPIAADETGRVLFNGYSTAVLTDGEVVRGDYLQTSTMARYAEAVADRGPGTFAVVTAAPDIAEFVEGAAVTESVGSVTSLAIDMPAELTTGGRVLFLALWRDPAVTTTPTLAGWTRIGSTSGFYYYYRLSSGSDTATASWIGATPAVGAVLMLDERVSVADPVEAQAFEATTAAAALAGLSDGPRYALAAAQDEISVDPTDWTLLGAGGVDPGTSVAVRQVKTADITEAAFDSNVLAGSVIVAVAIERTGADNGDPFVVITGTSTADTSWTDLVRTCDGGNDSMSIQAKASASAGAFGLIESSSKSAGKLGRVILIELTGAVLAGAQSAKLTDQTGTTNIDLGTFAGFAAGDIVVMAAQRATEADPSFATTNWTQHQDGNGVFHPWSWVATRTVDGVASTTFSNGGGTGWSAGAVHLRSISPAEGAVVGRYIGRDAAVTSPFTGVDAALDAIFALNLTAEPLASALLYGPDLVAETVDPDQVRDAGRWEVVVSGSPPVAVATPDDDELVYSWVAG